MTCSRCGEKISDRAPAAGLTSRISLTRTSVTWRLTFSRFCWHWLPENPQDRVSATHTELALCDWCTGDVYLFAQGQEPRPSSSRPRGATR